MRGASRLGLIHEVVPVQEVARLVEEYASLRQTFLPPASPRAILKGGIIDENLMRDTVLLGNHSAEFSHLRCSDIKRTAAADSRVLGWWKLPQEGPSYPSQLSHFFLYERLARTNSAFVTFGFLRQNGDHFQWSFRKMTRQKGKRKIKPDAENGKIVQIDLWYLDFLTDFAVEFAGLAVDWAGRLSVLLRSPELEMASPVTLDDNLTVSFRTDVWETETLREPPASSDGPSLLLVDTGISRETFLDTSRKYFED